MPLRWVKLAKIATLKIDAKKSDWEALVKFADEKFGRLDVVVNNAGTTYRNKV
jgi:NADP-dependent 3-hydroxy acid dehydrogenase YdfG